MANLVFSGGRFVASAFGSWSTTTLNTQAAGTNVLINLASGPVVSAADGTQFQPFATNAPLTFGFGLASQETVTPSAVSYTAVPGAVQVTVTTSNAHNSGETVISGSRGLQEAINFAKNGPGGTVVIDPTYLGTTAQIAATVGASNVGIEDVRVNQYDRTSIYKFSGSTDVLPVQYTTAFITTGSADAATLALPVAGADDGKILTVISTTAFAHTITTPASGLQPGNLHICTFTAAAGNYCQFTAFNGAWWVGNKLNATIT
jgi:hypothetical protein